LTGWWSFNFSAVGIVGVMLGAIVLAAVSGPSQSSAIVDIMRRARPDQTLAD
jgi:hypothetical protein